MCLFSSPIACSRLRRSLDLRDGVGRCAARIGPHHPSDPRVRLRRTPARREHWASDTFLQVSAHLWFLPTKTVESLEEPAGMSSW